MARVRRLLWDPGNVAHIARHAVGPEEVEQACHGEPIVREAYGGRLMLIGPTAADKMLAVVLEPAGEGTYYPVTARPASRKERRIYATEKGGEDR
jgi:uncharacterized DUF497 family protein